MSDVKKTETGSKFATLWPPCVKSIWRYNSVGDRPICIKFSRPVQNHMSMTVKKSKSKLIQVEFQYGVRLFSETGSSNISAVHWDTWSKFGTPITLDLPKCQMWPKQKPKVDLRRYETTPSCNINMTSYLRRWSPYFV